MSGEYEHLTIAQVARYPRPGTSVPGALRFTPDGSRLAFLHSGEGSLVRALWCYDLATGARSLLLEPPREAATGEAISREEELRRERARLRDLGVTDYQFAREAEPWLMLVPLAGKLYVQRDGGTLIELPGTNGALDARLSADGSRVAFVRDGELFACATDGSGAPRQLTSDAEPGLTNGVAEFIAQEELDRSEGFWWDPKGEHIAFIRADSRHIPPYPIVHQGLAAADVEVHRYPFAGAENARLTLGVVEADSGETSWLNLGEDADIYIARVAWRPSGELMVAVLSRDQRTLRWLEYAPGAAQPTLFLTEHSEPWLNLDHDTRFLETGETVLSSERSGFRHLYLHDRAGEPVRMLTSGDWVVTRLVAVDERGRRAYFEGTREGVTERHLYTVPLDGGQVERLTTEAGWHSAVLSPDFSWFADMHSTLAHAPTVTLRRLDGKESHVIHSNDDHTAAGLGLTPPRLTTIQTEDGAKLQAAIYEARDPSGVPPLIVSVYGGPHAQRVADEWSLTVDLRAQYLAQQGYCVVKLDNRGSANRGLAFEAPLKNAFGTVELEDHLEALNALQRMGIADTERTGIYGWSYGGYMTLMAMLRAPNMFRVGVAGAPVTDWDGYDTGYTERYMGTPQANPDGYRSSSALTHVGGLRGKLLLVHGMIDENVHFRHTARLMSALAAAQKPYDLLVFPEERHMPRDAKGMEYQEQRVIGYFLEHLPPRA